MEIFCNLLAVLCGHMPVAELYKVRADKVLVFVNNIFAAVNLGDYLFVILFKKSE